MWSKEYLRVQTITMKNLSPCEREKIDTIIGRLENCGVRRVNLILILIFSIRAKKLQNGPTDGQEQDTKENRGKAGQFKTEEEQNIVIILFVFCTCAANTWSCKFA